jgi:hypothetical protein
MQIKNHKHITQLSNGTPCNIHYLDIEVNNIAADAQNLITIISNNSWITNLDPIARATFETKVQNTASVLVQLFNSQIGQSNVAEEFGEYMISMHSAESLRIQLGHKVFPLAELWKEKVKNNHGFDFHTETPNNTLAFGEAKYKSSGNAYITASEQVVRFISPDEKKDYGDLLFLQKLGASNTAVNNLLNNNKRSFILGFSVNSTNIALIQKNSLENANVISLAGVADELFLIGVHIV